MFEAADGSEDGNFFEGSDEQGTLQLILLPDRQSIGFVLAGCTNQGVEFKFISAIDVGYLVSFLADHGFLKRNDLSHAINTN